MIRDFERTARRMPDAVFFRFADADGSVESVTYRQARLRAAALQCSLVGDGLESGGFVAADMNNCPAYIYLVLAAQYGGWTLVALNHRLTDAEKQERLATVRAEDPSSPLPLLDEDEVRARVAAGQAAESERILLHRADKMGGTAGRAAAGTIMFTSGTTGKPKAARLGAEQLRGSAQAYNEAFGSDRATMWQIALPLYHVGGLQMLVRSLAGGTPFLLYRRFDARRILDDAIDYRATNVSVVDKTLRELLKAVVEECKEAPDVPAAPDLPDASAPASAPESDASRRLEALRGYRCILLGGSAPNPATLERARALQAPVFASYGMTETGSLVAACRIDDGDGTALHLLPGYEACIAGPDENGRGQLGIRGPGVFGGYLRSRALFTADGFFLTGDIAQLDNGRIRVAERTQDMFVSGGENVYPEEIRTRLLSIPGVTDAYVFGARDATWGWRPVAFVEMSEAGIDVGNAIARAEEVRRSVEQRLARIYRPDRLYALGSFSRSGIGKTDRAALERLDAEALDVREVRLHRVRQPFTMPVRTAKTVLRERESLLVEVVDAAGRVGTGEDAAFATDWYLPETIGDDLEFLEKHAIPCVLRQSYLRPDAVYAALAALPGAGEHLMAVAALETALWDLYGKIVQAPISRLIGARDAWDVEKRAYSIEPGYVPGGAVIGLMSTARTVEAARRAAEAGYLRVKLKICPGQDVERVAAVRRELPDLIVALDANQSYTENDGDRLRALDELHCACLEEPLDPSFVPSVGPKGLFARLARLQRTLATPIFLDESIVTPADAEQAFEYPDLRGFVLKVGKWGGVLPSVDFYQRARARGAQVWMGGMYDTGVSKRLHAALSLLPGITIPGDINDTARYFAEDVTAPSLVLEDGCLPVNPPEAPYGVGCSLDADALARLGDEVRVYRTGAEPEKVSARR